MPTDGKSSTIAENLNDDKLFVPHNIFGNVNKAVEDMSIQV